MGLKHYHDNHHITTDDHDRPTGGPAFVAHTSGYNNDNDDNDDNVAAPAYYYDHYNYYDAPAHNDDDYARAHNHNDNGYNDYDEYDDPADYEHLVADHDNCSHNNNFNADWNDYYNRWVNYFDKPINEHSAANHYDIEGDFHYPPPDDYYRRDP